MRYYVFVIISSIILFSCEANYKRLDSNIQVKPDSYLDTIKGLLNQKVHESDLMVFEKENWYSIIDKITASSFSKMKKELNTINADLSFFEIEYSAGEIVKYEFTMGVIDNNCNEWFITYDPEKDTYSPVKKQLLPKDFLRNYTSAVINASGSHVSLIFLLKKNEHPSAIISGSDMRYL